MDAPDFTNMPPIYSQKWREIREGWQAEDRHDQVAELRFFREMRKRMVEDAVLNDREADTDQVDAVIGSLTEKLVGL